MACPVHSSCLQKVGQCANSPWCLNCQAYTCRQNCSCCRRRCAGVPDCICSCVGLPCSYPLSCQHVPPPICRPCCDTCCRPINRQGCSRPEQCGRRIKGPRPWIWKRPILNSPSCCCDCCSCCSCGQCKRRSSSPQNCQCMRPGNIQFGMRLQ